MVYRIALDGLALEVDYQHDEVYQLLDFLLQDMHQETENDFLCVSRLAFSREQDEWLLAEERGSLAVRKQALSDLALLLLNTIMMRFAAHNQRSIALHAGLISDCQGSILLPGGPGAGKSNACLWLCHLGMRYHSDEMVTLNRETFAVSALTRPFTLKKPLATALQTTMVEPLGDRYLELSGRVERKEAQQHPGQPATMMESECNLWLAHRWVNSSYCYSIPPLKGIVFPFYSTEKQSGLAKISAARAAMELMRGQFHGQRFEDHGFTVLSTLVRQVPVHIMVYNDFEQLATLLQPLMEI